VFPEGQSVLAVQGPQVKEEHFGEEAGQLALAIHSLQVFEAKSHLLRAPVQSASEMQATQVPVETTHKGVTVLLLH
jgi:hypothetical protein